jgi:APA family basic amino acid/polyamine antiporter
MDADDKPELVRAITPIGASLLILNGMMGAGIFALPATVAVKTGMFTPWLFVIVGAMFITIALSFAELASYFRLSGGPVLYTSTAFGANAGFVTGWILWLGRVAGIAANMSVLALYMGAVVPWVADGIGRTIMIIVICASLTGANILGVKEGVRTVAIFTVLKITPLVILILAGIPHYSAEVVLPSTLPSLGNTGSAALLLMYAFVGFETALVPAAETANPKRALPRALVITMLVTAGLYWLISVVYVSLLPPEVIAAGGSTLADVGRVLAGPTAALVITFAVVFSIIGNTASAMVGVPRVTYALAENHWLPAWFGRIHPKFQTPANSVMFYGAAVTLAALPGSFAVLAAAGSLARIIVYLICIAALPRVRAAATPDMREGAYRLPGGYAIPIVAIVICLWACTQAAAQSWLLVGGVALAGMALFWITRRAAVR